MRRALALAVALSGGCGQALVGDEYRGAPLWSFTGDLQRAAGATITQPMLALFFAPSLATTDPEQFTELTASTTAIAEVPAPFVLDVYALPPPALLVGGADYGVARLLVYDDLDGNGRHTPGEPFVGMDPPAAVVYAPSSLPAASTPGHGDLAVGFHRVYLPQPCSYLPPSSTTSGNCGVPLGERCAADADCGSDGMCLTQSPMPWPAGYCVVPSPSPSGCRPGAGAFMYRPPNAALPPALVGFYGRACAADADCLRSGPQQGNQYDCDPGLRACLPVAADPLIPVGQTPMLAPFCAGTAPPPPTMRR